MPMTYKQIEKAELDALKEVVRGLSVPSRWEDAKYGGKIQRSVYQYSDGTQEISTVLIRIDPKKDTAMSAKPEELGTFWGPTLYYYRERALPSSGGMVRLRDHPRTIQETVKYLGFVSNEYDEAAEVGSPSLYYVVLDYPEVKEYTLPAGTVFNSVETVREGVQNGRFHVLWNDSDKPVVLEITARQWRK